jgi:hypothetical protein
MNVNMKRSTVGAEMNVMAPRSDFQMRVHVHLGTLASKAYRCNLGEIPKCPSIFPNFTNKKPLSTRLRSGDGRYSNFRMCHAIIRKALNPSVLDGMMLERKRVRDVLTRAGHLLAI